MDAKEVHSAAEFWDILMANPEMAVEYINEFLRQAVTEGVFRSASFLLEHDELNAAKKLLSHFDIPAHIVPVAPESAEKLPPI